METLHSWKMWAIHSPVVSCSPHSQHWFDVVFVLLLLLYWNFSWGHIAKTWGPLQKWTLCGCIVCCPSYVEVFLKKPAKVLLKVAELSHCEFSTLWGLRVMFRLNLNSVQHDHIFNISLLGTGTALHVSLALSVLSSQLSATLLASGVFSSMINTSKY